MLTVYTYRVHKPDKCFDLSCLPLDSWIETVTDIVSHQTSGTIWFGYLEGWMLTPHEEVVLRKALRQFDCEVVSKYPHSFSHAWKNEIDWVYTDELNGFTDTNDDGSALQHGGSPKHRQPSTKPTAYGFDH
jgi:hypothetical protein